MIAVGDLCTVERYWLSPASVHNRHVAPVTRITATRVYMRDAWFALDDPQRIVRPRYLDYTTHVVSIEAGQAPGVDTSGKDTGK